MAMSTSQLESKMIIGQDVSLDQCVENGYLFFIKDKSGSILLIKTIPGYDLESQELKYLEYYWLSKNDAIDHFDAWRNELLEHDDLQSALDYMGLTEKIIKDLDLTDLNHDVLLLCDAYQNLGAGYLFDPYDVKTVAGTYRQQLAQMLGY